MSGLEALSELTGFSRNLRTILLTSTIDNVQLLTAVQLGVRGLVLKDATTEVLLEAIRCVMAGRYWLGQTLVTDFTTLARPLIQSATPRSGHLSLRFTQPANESNKVGAADHLELERVAHQYGPYAS